jgi:hypothetical protein
MRALIVTTINAPNKVLRLLADGARAHDVRFIIAGDTKTPADFELPPAEYLSVTRQTERFPDFCRVLPVKHYARKNAAYLAAIADGATEILETDDDNLPYDDFWLRLADQLEVAAIPADASCPWFNVYSRFSNTGIWPRGFPLEFLQMPAAHDRQSTKRTARALIVQGLANGNPDVDAVYRLTQRLPVDFVAGDFVFLNAGVWCPFNSQNTVFRREVFPLLYLPSHCSFRMTDIWRAFVAQRCLWEMGEGLIFQSATVYQERNEHNLLRDFADEVPGYLLNERIRGVLENCVLDGKDLVRSLSLCYESLVRQEFLPDAELPVLSAWCREMDRKHYAV